MSDLEGTVGYSLPKICVLFPMVVGSRRIADDTETDERYLISVSYTHLTLPTKLEV